jgi:uncharacterized tellurite resistance protein B-like protein
MSLLLRFLGISTETPAAQLGHESLTRIAAVLDGFPPDRARLYACFAYVLARVAGADLRIRDGERAAMEETLIRCAGIPAAEARVVSDIAQGEVERLGATNNYIVTREFGRLSTTDEKLQLLECLFAVAAADDVITGDESSEITLIAKEIGLAHADVLAVRSRFREKLAELRPLPRERR